jgi:prophage regulatory protein
MNTPDIPVRMIDLREVERRTGLKRDSIYRLGKLGRMPQPVKVSERASRWVGSEIDSYVADRIAERDAKAAT